MQSKLEETEKNSIKEGKRLTQKLEKRVGSLTFFIRFEFGFEIVEFSR